MASEQQVFLYNSSNSKYKEGYFAVHPAWRKTPDPKNRIFFFLSEKISQISNFCFHSKELLKFRIADSPYGSNRNKKPGRQFLSLFFSALIILLSGCKVQVFDLQPVIPTVPSATFYQTPTPLQRQTNAPRPDVTSTPPIHLAPTKILQAAAIDLIELVMIDGANGWGIAQIPGGEGKMIVRTVDGGSQWKNVTPSDALYLHAGKNVETSAFFLDASRAWLLYWEPDQRPSENGIPVWYTTDGAVTWQSAVIPLGNFTLQYFNNVQIGFVDHSIGWIFANIGKNQDREFIGLYTTHDGGLTWSLMVSSDSVNLPSKGGKNGVVFRNATEGWISGSNTRDEPDTLLWQTYDGGNTWTKVTLPDPQGTDVPQDLLSNGQYRCTLTVPRFVDFQLQYAWSKMTCSEGSLAAPIAFIYWTYDAGKTWRTMRLPKADGSLAFYGIYQGWYSQKADPGSPFEYEILSTANGGVNWNVISQTAWDSNLQFITAAVGWGIVNYQGRYALVKTEDSGYTWSQIFPMVYP